MGKDFYDAAIRNPETLAQAIDRKDVECFFFEEFAYVAKKLYKEKTGNRFIEGKTDFKSEPAGKRWNEIDDELKNRLPILFKKCNP